ncbi:MAG TPA: hypothetical protein VGK77_24440 [Candidatus Binatia bacterium]|jgi:hypothetical protein
MADKISALQERIDCVVDEMKHLIDPKYQVEHRPWLMVGLSLVAGYLSSRLILARSRSDHDSATRGGVSRAPQSSGLVGGLVSAVLVGVVRDFAMNLMMKRRPQTWDNVEQSANTTAPQPFH